MLLLDSPAKWGNEMTKKQYEAPVLRKAGKLSSVTADNGASGPIGPAG